MNDLISREAVLNTLDNMDKVLDEDGTVEAYKDLLKECFKELPPVEPKGDLISKEETLMALTGINLPTDRDKLIALFNERIKALPSGMICDKCLKKLSKKDQPYKCFSKGLERGQKDIVRLELKLAKAEEKLNAIRIELTHVKGFAGDKHLIKVFDILNDDSPLAEKGEWR